MSNDKLKTGEVYEYTPSTEPTPAPGEDFWRRQYRDFVISKIEALKLPIGVRDYLAYAVYTDKSTASLLVLARGLGLEVSEDELKRYGIL